LSFYDEEVAFYIDHISKNVIGEYCAIKWLLEKLFKGITDREKIHQELKKDYGAIWKTSDAVINTQRTGLISRVFELGLLAKERQGTEVKYVITEKGKLFIK